MSHEYDGYSLPELQYKEDTPMLQKKRAELSKELDELAVRFHENNSIKKQENNE